MSLNNEHARFFELRTCVVVAPDKITSIVRLGFGEYTGVCHDGRSRRPLMTNLKAISRGTIIVGRDAYQPLIVFRTNPMQLEEWFSGG